MASNETLAEIIGRKLAPVTGRAWMRIENFGALKLGIFIIVVSGFLIRFLSTDYGLPYAYDWDEPEILQSSMQILRNGTYGPVISGRIGYGPLNSTLFAGWGAGAYLRGIGKGQFPDGIWGLRTERDTGYYWTIPSAYLWKQERILSALIGTLSILLIYAAGRVLGGTIVGVGAAAVLAFGETQIVASSYVTPDSPALAALCGCCLASALILRRGSVGNYLAAFSAAAMAAGFKLNYAVALALPILAHLIAFRTKDRPFWIGRLMGSFVLYFFLMLVFFSHAILYPTLFLHNYGTEVQIHIPKDGSHMGFFRALQALGMKWFTTLDAGRFGGAQGYGSSVTFTFAAAGLPLVLGSLYGIYFAWRTSKKEAMFLSAFTLLVFGMVGPTLTFFFPRHMLPMLPAAALWVGFGLLGITRLVTYVLSNSPDRALTLFFSFCAALVLFFPVMGKAARDVWYKHSYKDPREQMASYLNDFVAPNSSILVCSETRWYFSPEERKKYKMAQSTLPRLLANPPSDEVRYILAPLSIKLSSSDPGSTVAEATVNKWLAHQKPVNQVDGGPAVMDAPPANFGIKLIENHPEEPIVSENAIYGTTFDGGVSLDPGVSLANGPAALKTGPQAHAKVRITRPTAKIRLRARGTAPLPQSQPATVTIDVTQVADKTFSKPVGSRNFVLTRSQGGMADYYADAGLQPGDYRVRISATDVENRPVLVAGVSFE